MNDTKIETSNKSKNQIPSSLKFPKLDLETCLNKIKMLFARHSTNAMSSTTIATAIGDSESSSSLQSALASLECYGLLESVGNEHYHISEFIVNHCLERPLKREDIQKCISSVPVNRKLFATYDIDDLPSDTVIKAFLINDCKYSLKEATTYMEIFNKNRSMYDGFSMDTNALEPIIEQAAPDQTIFTPPAETIPSAVPLLTGNTFMYSHLLSGGKCVTIQIPENINELGLNDLEDAKDLLVLVLGKIERRAKQLEAENATTTARSKSLFL